MLPELKIRMADQRYLADAQELGDDLRLEPIGAVKSLTDFYDNQDQYRQRTDLYGGHTFTDYLYHVQKGSLADAIANIPNKPDPVRELDTIKANFTVPFRELTRDEISQIMHARQMASALRLPIPEGGQLDINAIHQGLESTMWQELGEYQLPKRPPKKSFKTVPDFYPWFMTRYEKPVSEKEPEYFPQMLVETLQRVGLVDSSINEETGAISELERINQYYEKAVDILNHERDPRFLAIASLLLPGIMERLWEQYVGIMFTMEIVRDLCSETLGEPSGRAKELKRYITAAQNANQERYHGALRFRFFGPLSTTRHHPSAIRVSEIVSAFNQVIHDYQTLNKIDPDQLEQRSKQALKLANRLWLKKWQSQTSVK